MILVHIHSGGGCQAIVREDGNELTDLEVHRYLCPNPVSHVVRFEDAGFEKKLCSDHASEMTERYGEICMAVRLTEENRERLREDQAHDPGATAG